MPYVASVPGHFAPLLPLETRLHDALRSAAEHRNHDIATTAVPGADNRVRAAFFRWLVLEAIPRSRLPITRLKLHGATIDGSLDFGGARLALRLGFRRCEFPSPLVLTDATIPGFELIGGSLRAIYADRLTVHGSLFIAADLAAVPRAPIEVAGAIRLNGATVHGNLDMEGACLGAELTAERGCLPPPEEAAVCRADSPDSPQGRIQAHKARGIPCGQHDAVGDHIAWVSLEADGLSVDGHLRCVARFRAIGEMRLDGCRIGRNLDFAGASLKNFGGYTLSAAGAQITGSLYLGSPLPEHRTGDNPRFHSRGMVRIDGARVEGDLDCSDGCFEATAFLPNWHLARPFQNDAFALKANGVEIGANARLTGRFEAHGNVSFLNATVGRDFYLTDAHFNFPGGEALCCDGASVAGVVFMQGRARRFRTNGVLRFLVADVRQGFYVRKVTFDCSTPPQPLLNNPLFRRFRAPDEMWRRDPPSDVGYACGIYAGDAKLAGSFIWKGVARVPARTPGHYDFWLHIPGARADMVDDDLDSWERLNRFDIVNCFYRSIDDLFHFQSDVRQRWDGRLRRNVRRRLALLDGEYAPFRVWFFLFRRTPAGAIDRFKPQPYMQFARVLRAAGLDGEADKVIVRLERNRTRYGGFTWLHKTARWLFLEVGLKYGFGRARPAWALLVWAAVSSIVFELAYSRCHIEATWHNKQNLLAPWIITKPRVAFNAPIFALDTLIPLVNLDQKDNWEVEPLSHRLPDTEGRSFSWRDMDVYRTLRLSMPDRLVGWLIIFNKFFGWLLATLLAGGVTGVLRGGKELPEIPGDE